jgi:hypothetical protein
VFSPRSRVVVWTTEYISVIVIINNECHSVTVVEGNRELFNY